MASSTVCWSGGALQIAPGCDPSSISELNLSSQDITKAAQLKGITAPFGPSLQPVHKPRLLRNHDSSHAATEIPDYRRAGWQLVASLRIDF